MWPEEECGRSGQARDHPGRPSDLPADSDLVHAAAWAACTVRTLAAEHNVLWFEVPVDDALRVEMAQGQCDLCQVETAETRQDEGQGRGNPGSPPRRKAGSNTHQAVSSRKMPSRSRCVKSSPPATQTCQQLCTATKLLCSPSVGVFLGSGARNSRPTCLTELPWAFNSIQQTSTDAYSVPGPVLGDAGDTEMERPSHCPQGAQSNGETDMHTRP